MSREQDHYIQLGKDHKAERNGHIKKAVVGAVVTAGVALVNPVVAVAIPGSVTLYQLFAAVDSQIQTKQRR